MKEFQSSYKVKEGMKIQQNKHKHMQSVRRTKSAKISLDEGLSPECTDDKSYNYLVWIHSKECQMVCLLQILI